MEKELDFELEYEWQKYLKEEGGEGGGEEDVSTIPNNQDSSDSEKEWEGVFSKIHSSYEEASSISTKGVTSSCNPVGHNIKDLNIASTIGEGEEIQQGVLFKKDKERGATAESKTTERRVGAAKSTLLVPSRNKFKVPVKAKIFLQQKEENAGKTKKWYL